MGKRFTQSCIFGTPFACIPPGGVHSHAGTVARPLSGKGQTVRFPGHELRQRRLELNMTPDTAAAACSIPVTMLEALENSQMDRLPGETYAVGFIRSYCRLLGLESEHYLGALRTAQHPFMVATSSKPSLVTRAFRKLPIPRLPRVSSEASMWVIIMISVAAAWFGYSAVFRPQTSAQVTQVHAAEIDLRLPESLDR